MSQSHESFAGAYHSVADTAAQLYDAEFTEARNAEQRAALEVYGQFFGELQARHATALSHLRPMKADVTPKATDWRIGLGALTDKPDTVVPVATLIAETIKYDPAGKLVPASLRRTDFPLHAVGAMSEKSEAGHFRVPYEAGLVDYMAPETGWVTELPARLPESFEAVAGNVLARADVDAERTAWDLTGKESLDQLVGESLTTREIKSPNAPWIPGKMTNIDDVAFQFAWTVDYMARGLTNDTAALRQLLGRPDIQEALASERITRAAHNVQLQRYAAWAREVAPVYQQQIEMERPRFRAALLAYWDQYMEELDTQVHQTEDMATSTVPMNGDGEYSWEVVRNPASVVFGDSDEESSDDE